MQHEVSEPVQESSTTEVCHPQGPQVHRCVGRGANLLYMILITLLLIFVLCIVTFFAPSKSLS